MNFKKYASEIEKFLELDRKLVGVKILTSYSPEIYHFQINYKIRYCEAVLRASKGKPVAISKENIKCPSSEVALGFEEPKYAEFERIIPSKTKHVLLCSIDQWKFSFDPDLILCICNPGHAMQISSAVAGISFSVKGEIAFCGELTSHTFMENKGSLSLLCDGCRIYAGFQNHELGVSLTLGELELAANNFKKKEKIAPRIRIDRDMSPSSRLIIEVIRSRGHCSQRELVSYTGLSERSIRNSLRQLKNKKMITEFPDPVDRRRKEYRIR